MEEKLENEALKGSHLSNQREEKKSPFVCVAKS